jgi:hypothetical protein
MKRYVSFIIANKGLSNGGQKWLGKNEKSAGAAVYQSTKQGR